jgi:hypothetical protein
VAELPQKHANPVGVVASEEIRYQLSNRSILFCMTCPDDLEHKEQDVHPKKVP